MPNSISSTGLTTATYQELLAQYTTNFQTIYGADINLSSDTPDGQQINIQIQAILDLLDLQKQIYNSFDPDSAIGNVLDQRVAINGIQRQGGTFTTTNITIVTTTSVTLYGMNQSTNPIYTVADNAGNQWQLISTVSIPGSGTYVEAFEAVTPGAVLTVPNTITVPVSVVLGVTSVNNPTLYSTLGENEETDAALRIRRQQSVSNPSQGWAQGLRGTLLNINGVTSAFIHENTTDMTDGDGVPSHTIWVIVAGTPTVPVATAWSDLTTYSYGQLASSAGVNYISWKNNNLNNAVSDPAFWGVYDPVAEAIYAKRNAGAGMFGSINYTITQQDGSLFVVKYDSVQAENLFIKFTATSLNGVNPPNIAAIVAGLPSIYVPGVDAEVNINQLATLVQDIDPNTLVTNAGFSTSAGGSYTNTLTPNALNKQFVVESANTIVLPMILNPVSSTIAISTSVQFSALGGYGTLTYSISVNNTGGSINSSSGLYTAGTNHSVTDTILVTDSLSNTATASVTTT